MLQKQLSYPRNLRGRHASIDKANRLCRHCQEAIEDEYHFLRVCKAYSDLRNKHLPRTYIIGPNYNKFNILMASENEPIVMSIAMYLYCAFRLRQDLLSA